MAGNLGRIMSSRKDKGRMYAVEDILQITGYRVTPMPRIADIRRPPSPLRSTPDQQTGARTVSGKKHGEISAAHSGLAVVLNAGTRKCRRTDRHSRYWPWRRIQACRQRRCGTQTVSPLTATTHPRHAPLRTRLWFRLCDAYADSGAGMRPTPSCEQLVEGHR